MATGALSSRALAGIPSECCVAAAAGASGAVAVSKAGVRLLGCEIIGLAVPAAQFSSLGVSAPDVRWITLHFGLIECLRVWRVHHTMWFKTANCVATIGFSHGLAGWEAGWEAVEREYRRGQVGGWAMASGHPVADAQGVVAPFDDIST